jgi:hypothetical protein
MGVCGLCSTSSEYSARLLGAVDPLSVKHMVTDEAAVDRTHPTFYPLIEQWEQHTQAIQALRVGQAFIRMPDDSVRRVNTPRLPELSIPREKVQEVQRHYLAEYFRPVPQGLPLTKLSGEETCGGDHDARGLLARASRWR